MAKGQKNEFSGLFKVETSILPIAIAGTVGTALFVFALIFFTESQSILQAVTASVVAGMASLLAGFFARRTSVAKLKSLEIALEDIKTNDVTIGNFREIERKQTLIEFERNIAQPVQLLSVETDGFDMFQEFTWAMQPRINVLLGRNGFGKSRLLQTLAALLAKDSDRCDDIFRNSQKSASVSIHLQRVSESRDIKDDDLLIKRQKDYFSTSIGKVPVLAIPDSRFINKSRTEISFASEDVHSLREDGSYHFLYQKPYEAVIQNFLYDACIDYLKLPQTFDKSVFKLIQGILQELTGSKFEFKRVQTLGQARFSMDVIAEGRSDVAIPIQVASQGTLSVLAMFGLIFNYLRAIHPDAADRNLMQQRAIVIIDEIDAHIHPAWQRKILTLLRQTFPNSQFIVTAHSPLVVAGCLEREVSVLRRDKGGGFALYQFNHDFIGWDPTEIYREVFNVEERDETYNTLNALYPDKERLEQELGSLKAKQRPSANDELRIKELQDRIYYIERAREAQTRRKTQKDLELENYRLKLDLGRLTQTSESPSGNADERPR